jgi:hypothetical protein
VFHKKITLQALKYCIKKRPSSWTAFHIESKLTGKD